MKNTGESQKRGDIVVVDGHETTLTVRRLALVIRAEEKENHLQVMLCHDDRQLASIVDVIIAAPESGLSYDLVVETDLFSVIWKSQVTKTIGKISREHVQKIMAHAADPDGLVAGIQSGYAIRGLLDPRWKFKESEGKQFRNLCGDCVLALLADNSVTVDLDIFTLCDEDEILRFLQLIKQKKIVLTQTILNEMDAIGLFSRSFWKERFPKGGFGDALYKAVSNLIPIPEDLIKSSEEMITQGRINNASPLCNAGYPIITSASLWIDFELTSEIAPTSLQLLSI